MLTLQNGEYYRTSRYCGKHNRFASSGADCSDFCLCGLQYKGTLHFGRRKGKLIDVTVTDTSSYRVGDRVCVVGEVSMGALAVLYAFIFPFLILVISLFVFMSIWKEELSSALVSFLLLALYYGVLWMNRSRMSKKFSFSIKPMIN